MKRFLLMLTTLAAIGAALYFSGDAALHRAEEASALHCARASDGTDSSIADCYTQRGLPIPEDL